MSRFLKECFIFFVCFCAPLYIFYYVIDDYRKIDWEKHPFTVGEQEDFDIVFLGSSHVRVISALWEKLGSETFGFPPGLKINSFAVNGGGLLMEQAYLEHFLQKKNSTKYILFFIDPFMLYTCLLYTSPSPRDATLSRMPSSA